MPACVRTFSFHGIAVAVESEDESFLAAVEHDFSFFLAPTSRCDLAIRYEMRKPEPERWPVMTAALATPRNICYRHGDQTYIDYFGRALNLYNAADSSCRIYAEDRELAREIAYLTVLSRVSEKLGRKGMHRIHALGLEHRGRGILIMLPCGGGKTTLALSILTAPDCGIRLISEDSPLITRSGTLLPFPLRLGVHPQNLPAGIDDRFLLHEKRMEFTAKISIDIRYFGGRLAGGEIPAAFSLLGIRSTGLDARITPVSRLSVIRHAMMNSVIGVGLYQGMEFIMQQGMRSLMSQSRVALSRMFNNFQLLRRARIYSFVMGRDPWRNCRALTEFLEKTDSNH